LYVDESGDHTYKNLEDINRRYLGLTGIAIESEYYRNEFQPKLEALKQSIFPHSPDEPLVLHRDDIINKRSSFGVLRNSGINKQWETSISLFVKEAQFCLFTVIIDKKTHRESYGNAAFHPYHYCLTVLLERYRGYLKSIGGIGDVLAESRGGKEDMSLKAEYQKVWKDGTYYISAPEFQKYLTSKELKVKSKLNNIAGLQLVDLLAHPSKAHILISKGIMPVVASFGANLAQVFQGKYSPNGKVLI